jgi:hypothetical protein
MSKITAQYVDTCLPDYLTDHHCRPGERLVMSALGVSLDVAVREMFDNADDVPDCFDDEEIKTAVREALAGVDLRWIDANGNRVDEAPEEHDDEEPMVYVVLRWEHPEEDWQHEVANGDTRLGYQEWREHQIEAGRYEKINAGSGVVTS